MEYKMVGRSQLVSLRFGVGLLQELLKYTNRWRARRAEGPLPLPKKKSDDSSDSGMDSSLFNQDGKTISLLWC
jgi:hypothetical protein